jgi:neural Wiskott-Aldrich syndrome protein
MQSGSSTRSVSTSGHSAASSSSSLVAFPIQENSVHDTTTSSPSHRAITPIGQRPHRYSIASSQSYEIQQYQPAYEPAPPPSRSSYHTPSRHGPRYSMPAASSGFFPVSSKFESPSRSPRLQASYGSEQSGLAPPLTNASLSMPGPGYTSSPTRTPAPMSFASGSPVSPAPAFSTASTSGGSFMSTSLSQQSQPSYFPQAGYNTSVSAPPSSHIPTQNLPTLPIPPQPTPPQAHPGLAQPVSSQPHEYASSSAPMPQVPTRVVSNHIPGSRPLPPQPQQAAQRVPPSAPISVNQAFPHAIGAPQLPYGHNQVQPPTSEPGPPLIQQNPLPVPPGPPGPLGPGFHTPPRVMSAMIPASSSYHYASTPSPQPSPSQHSPNLRIPDAMVQPSNSLPPSPVPLRTGRPMSISGRPSLPLPPPPPLQATGSYQQLPLPQLPIPPAQVPSSQSQQQYLTSSPSSVMQGGQQPFYPGPPPRPPTQITDSLQPTSYRQAAH